MEQREGSFRGHKDLNIYYQCWLPDGDAMVVLLVAHGYAEHSGRYQNLVDYFVPKGYAVYALDHRGHGRSDGERVQVDHYTDYLVDLKTFFDLVRGENPGLKVFLVGHSMGAMISLTYAAKYQDELDGLILSGGGIPSGRPRAQREAFDLAEALSRDRAVVEAYRNDPLVYHGPPRFSRESEMGKMGGELGQLAPSVKLPILIMAGSASPLGEGEGSRALYDVVGSEDKTLKLYEELLHEIFNEPEHREVMSDMYVWLSERA